MTADHPPVGGATGCSYKKPELKDALCASVLFTISPQMKAHCFCQLSSLWL